MATEPRTATRSPSSARTCALQLGVGRALVGIAGLQEQPTSSRASDKKRLAHFSQTFELTPLPRDSACGFRTQTAVIRYPACGVRQMSVMKICPEVQFPGFRYLCKEGLGSLDGKCKTPRAQSRLLPLMCQGPQSMSLQRRNLCFFSSRIDQSQEPGKALRRNFGKGAFGDQDFERVMIGRLRE